MAGLAIPMMLGFLILLHWLSGEPPVAHPPSIALPPIAPSRLWLQREREEKLAAKQAAEWADRDAERAREGDWVKQAMKRAERAKRTATWQESSLIGRIMASKIKAS
jgi:hypothetical protein